MEVNFPGKYKYIEKVVKKTMIGQRKPQERKQA